MNNQQSKEFESNFGLAEEEAVANWLKRDFQFQNKYEERLF